MYLYLSNVSFLTNRVFSDHENYGMINFGQVHLLFIWILLIYIFLCSNQNQVIDGIDHMSINWGYVAFFIKVSGLSHLVHQGSGCTFTYIVFPFHLLSVKRY
jgi:hypothetical protein